MSVSVTIVHESGSGTVENFEKIEEAGVRNQSLRVFYEEPGLQRSPHPSGGLFYETYHQARIVEVDASDDSEEGNDFIQVDE